MVIGIILIVIGVVAYLTKRYKERTSPSTREFKKALKEVGVGKAFTMEKIDGTFKAIIKE